MSNHLYLMYVLVAVSVKRYIMAQANSDKSKLFIHLYVYFASNLSKLRATYLDFVTHPAVRNNKYVSVVLNRMSFSYHS